MVWRGDATVVNQAIRNNDVSKLKYWGYWIVCFRELDRLVSHIETKDTIVVNRDVNEDIYSHCKLVI